MPTNKGTIGLCMIARNEAHVIERSLHSVRGLIDYVLVEDTGSTDGTQEVVRRWLDRHGIPGEVVEEGWRDFAFNRSHALERLRALGMVEYAFVLDADDRVGFDAGFDAAAFKRNMAADFYDVHVRYGSIQYGRPHILRADLAFSFRGVVHEFVVAPPEAVRRETCPGLWIEIVGGGGRSRDPAKFLNDVALLERELARETDPFMVSRYTFYLAQSCRDCGQLEKALGHYAREHFSATGRRRSSSAYTMPLSSWNSSAVTSKRLSMRTAGLRRHSRLAPRRCMARAGF